MQYCYLVYCQCSDVVDYFSTFLYSSFLKVQDEALHLVVIISLIALKKSSLAFFVFHEIGIFEEYESIIL